jgi:hypothetical protein
LNADGMDEKLRFLNGLGIPPRLGHIPVGGAFYLQHMGGPSVDTYWKSSSPNNLDEFMVVANSYLAVQGMIARLPHKHEWRLGFDGASLFQIKQNAQTIESTILLTSNRCYFDAFNLLRSLHSRVNLLLLFSLMPSLFDRWLKDPSQKCFREYVVRKELRAHGIHTLDHIYSLGSEIVHGNYEALDDVGFMEKGLFIDMPAVANRILVTGKFLFGIAGYVGLSSLIVDLSGTDMGSDLADCKELYELLSRKFLAHNRFNHLMTTLAEDRHWTQIDESHVVIGDAFDYAAFSRILSEFHDPPPGQLARSLSEVFCPD